MSLPRIGFIGQGFVGKSIADDFTNRGYDIVRFALEEPYLQNKEKIAECDVVFLAVPTPSTPDGFDVSIVRSVLPLVGKGKTVVIKSTLVPGTTDELQAEFSDIKILFSPEFLIARTAKEDAAKPIMNIIGVPEAEYVTEADGEFVMSHLPESSYSAVMSAREAELVKYAHNIHGFVRVIYTNLLYDMSQALGTRWEEIQKVMDADPYMTHLAAYYHRPVHRGAGDREGRGAGGPCFIKDFKAFREIYERLVDDTHGANILRALENKNIELLLQSGKDLDLLEGVYGSLDTTNSKVSTSSPDVVDAPDSANVQKSLLGRFFTN